MQTLICAGNLKHSNIFCHLLKQVSLFLSSRMPWLVLSLSSPYKVVMYNTSRFPDEQVNSASVNLLIQESLTLCNNPLKLTWPWILLCPLCDVLRWQAPLNEWSATGWSPLPFLQCPWYGAMGGKNKTRCDRIGGKFNNGARVAVLHWQFSGTNGLQWKTTVENLLV